MFFLLFLISNFLIKYFKEDIEIIYGMKVFLKFGYEKMMKLFLGIKLLFMIINKILVFEMVIYLYKIVINYIDFVLIYLDCDEIYDLDIVIILG